MNIIGMRQQVRKNQIGTIQATIEKALLKGKKIDYKQLLLSTMSSVNLSKRTAQDYIDIALFQGGFTKEDLKNGV